MIKTTRHTYRQVAAKMHARDDQLARFIHKSHHVPPKAATTIARTKKGRTQHNAGASSSMHNQPTYQVDKADAKALILRTKNHRKAKT